VSKVIGIDVQAARDCPYAIVDLASSKVIETGWLSTTSLAQSVQELAGRHKDAVFAIDAPRMPLSSPRIWYWRKDAWVHSSGEEKGWGRHCEIVIKACGIANPQWTPMAEEAPEWMRHGFLLYEALRGHADTLEVFPSASYRMLENVSEVRIDIPVAGFMKGPKDMLDAVVAAVTGMEFIAGRGQEVGGGDGLGTIVLPRGIKRTNAAVFEWPGSI
jgi:hypothetical protein